MDRNTTAANCIPQPKLIRTITAIRNAQLRMPVKKIDPHLLDVCGKLLTAGQALPVASAKQQVWIALNRQKKQTCRRYTANPQMVRIAVFLLLLLLIASIAIAAIPWLSSLIWDDDALQVIISPEAAQQSTSSNVQDRVLGQVFMNELDQWQINAPLPCWLPEGYALIDVESREAGSGWVQLIGYYMKAGTEDLLVIEVNQWDRKDAVSSLFTEKNAQPLEVHQLSSMTIACYENLGHFSACIIAEPCVITIAGDGLTYEELRKIALSANDERGIYDE